MKPTIIRARDNPFSAGRLLKVRYQWLPGSWDELLVRLTALRHRAAIVGPQGHGKTTLLEDLSARLEKNGFQVYWLRFNRQNRSLSGSMWQNVFNELHGKTVICVDGAEQLSFWQWRRLKQRSKQAAGLLITAHQAGMLPSLVQCKTTPELLANIVAQLVNEPSDQLRTISNKLFEKHDGNVRDALRELYDLFADGTMRLSKTVGKTGKQEMAMPLHSGEMRSTEFPLN